MFQSFRAHINYNLEQYDHQHKNVPWNLSLLKYYIDYQSRSYPHGEKHSEHAKSYIKT